MTELALQLRNIVSKWCAENGSNRDEEGTMSNGLSPLEHRTWDLGARNVGTDSDGHEKEKVGMVRQQEKKTWNRKHQSSSWNEDWWEAPWRKSQVEMEGHCQKRHFWFDLIWFIWNTSCSQDNTHESLIMTYFQCDPLMTCGGLEWEVESTTVTHSSADWWDLLLPLTQTPDRRDQRLLVSPLKDTGKAG